MLTFLSLARFFILYTFPKQKIFGQKLVRFGKNWGKIWDWVEIWATVIIFGQNQNLVFYLITFDYDQRPYLHDLNVIEVLQMLIEIILTEIKSKN